MSTQADQAALGYLWAWLKAKAEGDTVVRDFGAIGNGDGGINCVRVKVRDTVLSITPWGDHHHVIETNPQGPIIPQQGVAEDITEATPVATVTEPAPPVMTEARPSYGGAERYACPSCGARRWDWCVTKSGRKSTTPHSARDHMVTT